MSSLLNMWFRHCDLLSVYCVIGVYADYHNLIYDYFIFKDTPNIIGFSCNSIADNLSFIRKLSQMNIKVTMLRLNSESINQIVHTDYYKLGIFIDLSCYNNSIVAAALTQAANYRLYDELHYWLILSSNLQSTMILIDDSSFGISTDFIVAFNYTSESYDLYDFYNPWKHGAGQLHVTHVGSWNSRRGLYFLVNESKVRRRSNLNEMNLTTAFFESKFKSENMSLEEYLKNSERNPIDGWSKFGYIVLQIASEMLNFTISIKKIDKWEKGDNVGPMSRALNNSEIDVSGNPVRMSGSRLRMSKVVYPSWPLRSCFLFRSPQPHDIKFAYISRPFATEVWILITITLIISYMVLVTVLKFDANDSEISCISNSLLLTLGAISLQSTTFALKNISTRIAFTFLLVFGYFLNNYYSACIVSVRLDEAIFKVNDSLNELAKTGLKVASEPILFFDFFIKDSQWETRMFYSKSWIPTSENERFILPDKGMQLVKEGSYAYHTYPDVAYPFVNRFYANREICELTEVSLVRLADNAMAVTYNSTFTELFKVGFSRLTEHGLRRRWLNWLTATKPQCHKNILSSSSITISEFAPHFYIVAIGWLSALIIYFIEIWIYEYAKRTKIRTVIDT